MSDLERRPPLVRIFRDGKAVSSVLLTLTRYVIGRNSSADICLDDATVSRPHAELIRGPFGRWWVQDLGSTNGTIIDGKTVSRQMLHHRDRIEVGDFTAEFRNAPPERIRAAVDSRPSLGDDTLTVARVAPVSSRAGITPAHLAAVTALGRGMLKSDSGQQRLDLLCEAFINELPGDSSMALRLDEDGSSTIISGPFLRDGPDSPAPYCSTTLIQTLLRTGEPVVATNVSKFDGDPELSLAESVRPLAIIACPVTHSSGSLDVLWVEFPLHYATKQWRAMVELAADSYAQARMVSQMRQDLLNAARIEHDLEMAHEVQSRLLPNSTTVQGLDIAVGYEPSYWVGGDYVDALQLPDGRILLVVADVCGKGLSAALVSSSVHTMLHALTDIERDVATLVKRLNAYLCTHLPSSSFVTLLAIAIDPKTGALECLNAGHPPALVVSTSGELRWLQSERNVAVGMLSDAQYEVERSSIAAHDTLLMYTDGAFERFSPTAPLVEPVELGLMFASIVSQVPHASSEKLRARVSAALDAQGGGQLYTDDTTFLIARPHNPTRV